MSRFGFVRFVLVIALAAAAGVASAGDRDILAPTGALKAGLYPGTPTSILPNPGGEPRGVGYELGKALAQRLGVPYQPVVFTNNNEVLAAIKVGSVDAVFTNASAARAKEMDFGPVYLEIELGYLAAPVSSVTDLPSIDVAGRRVGVTTGSTSDATLTRELKAAEIVRIATFAQVMEMLAANRIDVFATNKATLFELAEKLPGSRVLGGRWGVERHAIAVPKGREAGHAFLAAFTEEAKAQGLVAAAIARAGLRGAVVAK